VSSDSWTTAEHLPYAPAIDSTESSPTRGARLPVSASTLRSLDPLSLGARTLLDYVGFWSHSSVITRDGEIHLASPTPRLSDAPIVTIFGGHAVPMDPIRKITACDSITIHIDSAATLERFGRWPSLLASTDRDRDGRRLVESRFTAAVAFAAGEWFEDGTESTFARTLTNLLFAFGAGAISVVERYLASPDANIEIAVEAAQWLGEVVDPDTREYRRALLEKTLIGASTARLRHGAAAGLAALDDPASMPVVAEALRAESNRALLTFLELLVDQLGRTQACPSS
jgi:hypothetical protein